MMIVDDSRFSPMRPHGDRSRRKSRCHARRLWPGQKPLASLIGDIHLPNYVFVITRVLLIYCSSNCGNNANAAMLMCRVCLVLLVSALSCEEARTIHVYSLSFFSLVFYSRAHCAFTVVSKATCDVSCIVNLKQKHRYIFYVHIFLNGTCKFELKRWHRGALLDHSWKMPTLLVFVFVSSDKKV